MADIAELKHMIISFRNSELQTLLAFSGRSKAGRKQELLTRALSLLKNCSPQVQLKIQELYRATIGARPPLTANSSAADLARRADAALAAAAAATTTTTKPQEPQESPSSDAATMSSSRSYLNGATSSTSRSSARQTRPPEQAVSSSSRTATAKAHHVPGASSYVTDYKMYESMKSGLSTSAALPVHPDVKLKRLPFYDNLGELLKPTSLFSRGPPRIVEEKGVKKQISEAYFIFHLTPQQAQEIAMSRDLRPGAKIEYTVQVQMRFCLLETTCAQDDNFPPSICVRVNGKMAPLPNPIPSNRPGVEPKRPSRPVNITALCRLSPTVPNRIDVSWASDHTGRAHCMNVDLVKRVTADILMTRLRNKGVRHPDHTRAMIKEKMMGDADNEIATCSLRVSVQCPLSKMRIQVPCRPTTCSHIQCFDAMIFLQMNERKATWVCPVCDKDAHFDVLAIDGYFKEVTNAAASDISEISFSEDGNWTPLKQSKKSEKGEAVTKQEPVSKSSSTTSTTPATTTTEAAGAATTPANGTEEGATKRKVVAVDLTLSDSDDDDAASKPPPAKRVAASTPSHCGTSASSSSSKERVNGSAATVTASTATSTAPYPVSGPTPVALTANQSVQHYHLGGHPNYGYNPTSTTASSTSTNTTSGYGGMSAYGLPPPASELMDLRYPSNMALLDYFPSNPDSTQSNAPNSQKNSRGGMSLSSVLDSDVVTLD